MVAPSLVKAALSTGPSNRLAKQTKACGASMFKISTAAMNDMPCNSKDRILIIETTVLNYLLFTKEQEINNTDSKINLTIEIAPLHEMRQR